MYGAKFMGIEEHKKFLIWHEVNKHLPFDVDFELKKYCKSDVDILKRGCLTYRTMFMQITKKNENDLGIDPFRSTITLPGVCHLVYRSLIMKPKSIALVADYGFDPTQNFSNKQIAWTKYLSVSENIRIEHCFNGKEKRIGQYSVDGYCRKTDTVYEFYGCFIHGCDICYKSTSYNPLIKQTMGSLYKRTQERRQYIKNIVKNMVEIWEHEWDQLVKDEDNVAAFVKNADIRPALRPRTPYLVAVQIQ